MKHTFLALSVLSLFGVYAQHQVSDFENLELTQDSYWNGAPGNNLPFSSGEAEFENSYSGYWSNGFAYSNKKDVTTAGFLNMYSAVAGRGVNRSSNYVIAQNNSTIRFGVYPYAKPLTGLYVTNGTYAALSMENGDQFAKKFGGEAGTDPDYFLLTIKGFSQGQELSTNVKFYLADFRSEDSDQDYIVKTWKWVDLSVLGAVDSLKFELTSSDIGAFGMNTPAFFCIDNLNQSYYADKVGTASSTAVSKDSSAIKVWASAAVIERGFQDISQQNLGYTTVGSSSSTFGKADGNVVSLGDGGVATLTFDRYIVNGAGPDFAVFENGFADTFLELATVQVSSDGNRFIAFPAVSNTQDIIQVGGFDPLNTKFLHNLAGKYKANYGTPFDLDDLKDSVGLDLNMVKYVRIIDVIGNIKEYATYDMNGNAINDPWSTGFASGGFDLDAVAVLNVGDVVSSDQDEMYANNLSLYPNPATDQVRINNYEGTVELVSASGHILKQVNIESGYILEINDLESGVYFVKTKNKVYKLIKS